MQAPPCAEPYTEADVKAAHGAHVAAETLTREQADACYEEWLRSEEVMKRLAVEVEAGRMTAEEARVEHHRIMSGGSTRR